MYFIIAGNASFVKEISLLYPGADWGGESAAIRDILQKSFNQKAQYGLMAKSRVLLRFLFVESSDIIKPSNPKRKRENCMRTITAAAITDTVARLCVQANTRLPDDIVAALVSSLLTMTTGRVPCLTWPGMTGRSAIQISMYLTDGTMGVLVEFAVFFMFFASFQFEIWKQKTTVYR